MVCKYLTILAVSFFTIPLLGQTLDDVRPFQTFTHDAARSSVLYLIPGLTLEDFDRVSVIAVDGRIGFPIGKNFELDGEWRFLEIDPEDDPGETGLSDLAISGRYHFANRQTRFSAGGYITLPFGKDELGQNKVNLGGFGTLRHPVKNELVITGFLGIDLREGRFKDRDLSLRLGGGLIYQTRPNLSFVGELTLESEEDASVLSGGLDYMVRPSGRFRAALGIGLDIDAPNILLTIGYAHFFR